MITNLRKKLDNRSKKSGFTLIELIIVIAIIAILVAIALPKFGEVRENANRKADVANGKDIQSAVISLINDDKIKNWTNGTHYTLNQQIDGVAAEDYLQTKGLKAKSKTVKNTDFTYTIDAQGDVVVYAGASGGYKEVYPNSELE